MAKCDVFIVSRINFFTGHQREKYSYSFSINNKLKHFLYYTNAGTLKISNYYRHTPINTPEVSSKTRIFSKINTFTRSSCFIHGTLASVCSSRSRFFSSFVTLAFPTQCDRKVVQLERPLLFRPRVVTLIIPRLFSQLGISLASTTSSLETS